MHRFIYTIKTTFKRGIYFSLIFIAIINPERSVCQYSNFLDYTTSLSLINPANTGNHEYDWNIYNLLNAKRFMSNAGINSLYIAGDYQVYMYPDKLSLGAGIVRNSFVSSPFVINMFFLSIAYHKQLENHDFHIGIQQAYLFNELAMNNLLFPDQYDRNIGGFNSAIASAEIINNTNINYLDLNLGLAYSYKYHNIKPEIGISFFHVNTPDIAYYSKNQLLKVEQLFYIRFSVFLSHEFVIIPNVFLISEKELLLKVLGAELEYGLNKYSHFVKSIDAGINFHLLNKDYPKTMVLSLGTAYNKLHIGINYNFFFSIGNYIPGKLKTLEISLIYNGFNSNTEKFSTLCEIF